MEIIDEFEEMINDVCGEANRGIELSKRRGRPTPDFYDLPIHHEDFMKWWKERDEEKNSMKLTIKCNCGATYKIYTEPVDIVRYDFQGQGSTASTDWYTQSQTVQSERFYCWRCGKPFSVTGSKILKIKSNQLEVVL